MASGKKGFRSGTTVLEIQMESLFVNVGLSGFGVYLSVKLIKEFTPIFIQRKMYGIDQCKRDSGKIPEPMGVITAVVYLVILYLFIPVPFYSWLNAGDKTHFPYHNLVEFLSGLSSITCMIFLGFADDVLDLRWRHKILFPTLASLPLLMVYFANFNSTSVIVPKQIQFLLGTSLNIGVLYYVYMGMTAVFCTNAINILAGINGLEAGQSLVVAIFVIIFDFIQLYRLETQDWYHYLSLYFLIPYVSTTSVLYYYNKYPAKVFVGDTFCYFSGMTFAVVGILGHFSKTMLLFFLPQILNFLYSIPQLFRWVPCPRHRLPKYDSENDHLTMSMALFKSKDMGFLGRLVIQVFSTFRLIHLRTFTKDDEEWTEISNMTLIVFCLKVFGPMHERSLTNLLLLIQVIFGFIALFVRFFMASIVYEHVH